jgi:hypothetical protein
MALSCMSRPIGQTMAAALALIGMTQLPALAQQAPAPTASAEAPFLALNDTAMNKMMADMAVKPTGNADRDFVAMMVPHHQGAIDMAQAELRYGQNPQLKTVAHEIIVDQLQEITLMRVALGEPLPQSVSSPTQAFSGATQTSPALSSDADQSQRTMPPAMQMAPTRPVGAHFPYITQ